MTEQKRSGGLFKANPPPAYKGFASTAGKPYCFVMETYNKAIFIFSIQKVNTFPTEKADTNIRFHTVLTGGQT